MLLLNKAYDELEKNLQNYGLEVKSVRLVVFSEKLWPEGSGGELATYLILKLLASTGDFEIEVYTGTQRPAQVPGASAKTIDFLRAPNKIQLCLNILGNKRYIEKAIKEADVVYVPRFSYPIIPIAKKLNKRVIVHLHGYQPVSYTSIILSTEVNKPMSDFKRTFILESRSHDLPKAIASTLATPLTKLIRRWVSMADRIICVSRRHEEILLSMASEYMGKTITLYNPPPEIPDTKKNLSEKPTLLYVGGDSYIKGFYVLLEALKILGKKGRTSFKLILTKKYSRKSLSAIEHLKKRCGLDIQVLGLISYEELIELHSKTWALLFPSIWEETFGYAVLETMLSGTVPIASRVGGLPEIVEGTFAENMLFEPRNLRSLVSRIESVLAMSEEELMDVGIALRESMLKRFNMESIKEQLVRVFLP